MSKSVRIWILSVCVLILMMIAVGGITRLTGSGLSIVEWKPIMGAIPPLTSEAWDKAFYQYQQYPEFRIKNSSMTLTEFKFIFFWEYLHRLIGRMLGVAFLIPFLYFLARKQIQPKLAKRLAVAFFLGGLQGALGWFMVKSGLADVPYVSHYRLAAHLGLAFVLLGYLFSVYLEGGKRPQGMELTDRSTRGRHRQFLHKFSNVLLGMIGIQVIYGALVAGLKAGFSYNTFPKMGSDWVPEAAFSLQPLVLNLFENPAGVQFTHRCIAWALVAGICTFAWLSRKAELSDSQRNAIHAWVAMLAVQFSLGVATILLVVPVSLGTAHQVGAALLFMIGLKVRFELRTPVRTEALDKRESHQRSSQEAFQGPSAAPSC